MAATLTGLVKSLLAIPLPTWPVYRDNESSGGVPAGGRWIVVREGLSQTPTVADTRGLRRRRELIQVDVWQQRAVEDETAAATVIRTLDAATPTQLAGGDGIARLRPVGNRRTFDEKAQLVGEQITVAVTRHLT